MSKREYFLQKGLHLQQQLSETTTTTTSISSSGGSKTSREVAKYRELCPPGTEDSQIIRLLEQHKGDAQRIENAISELWEDNRGRGQDDWATVEKKGKKQQPQSRGYYSSQQSYNNDSQGDQSGPVSADRFAGRGGRGAGRGRGSFASRGGRGGGRGRGGRGGVPRGESREQNGESPEEPTDDNEAAEGTQSSETSPESDTTASKKSGPKSAKPAPAVAVAPPPVGPILTGAWTKKPNLAGLIAKPKPAEPVAAPKPVETPAPAPAPVVAKSPSPKKKVEPKSPQKTRPSEPVVNEPAEKVLSPKKVVEKKIESPRISSGWGSLDVSTSGIGEWPSTTSESKTSTTPNAWARGSPLLTPVAVASSETASALPAVVPGSPKDIQIPRAESRSAVSSSTSPKQYLKMGKWDSAASTNLSLQFGSFSLNGVEHTESTSPRGWSSTTTTTTTTTTGNGNKAVSKTETQSAWSKVASPKEKTPLSPPRKLEPETSARKGPTTSAPPGLSVDSGRVTPKSSPSPRTFAPSAPSPASLPKPDDVKRNTPTRGQGHFQSQSASQTQTASKIGSGSGYATEFGSKPSGLYQASYNQYSMDLGGRATTATATATAGNIAQGQVASSSNTPKGAGGRTAGNSGVGAVGSTQSPSHGAQQNAQLQFQQSQQQGQQQPKQHAQQGQQQQNQQAHAQNQQQSVPQHHPQGYHPHYAPPPPPGMALPYNPYNYASYYQGYGYYQNPQYAQYSPRTQYPPRGSIPYGVEGPIPGFSNPPSIPVGYQDQHLLAHQHEYAGAIPQGFGEISGAYLQQPPVQGHHHHGHQQGAPQSHGKGSAPISSTQQSHGQRSNSGIQGYQNAAGAAGARDHTSSPPVPNVSAGMSAASYGGQHYGWASYGAQPVGGWGGHMMPQGYQQTPSQHQQQQQQQQHPGSHQQSYRQYGNSSAQSGSTSNDASNSNAGHAHAWSS